MNASEEYKEIGSYWGWIKKPWNYCEVYDPAFCCRPEMRMGRRFDGHVPSLFDYYMPPEEEVT